MNNENNINRKKLIVRYRQGTPIYPEPNLPEKIKEAVEHLKREKKHGGLSLPINHGVGGSVSLESTWFSLIQEILRSIERPLEGKKDRGKAVLCVLEALCSGNGVGVLVNVKSEILKNVNVLSGWSYSTLKRLNNAEFVFREEGKYYVQLNGQICEIMGRRTEKEERWDHIADSCLHTYGTVQAFFKLAALVNICLDFQSNPDQYPESILLVLPEVDGGTSFLNWKWHVKWLYSPRLTDWRPNNNLCDPKWLASDFLISFSEQEGIPEKELIPPEWKEPNIDWIERFKDYTGQLEFAVDTYLRFGDVAEVLFDFRGKSLRWINQTENMHALLIVPVLNRNDDKAEYELGMRFLSFLSFDTDIPVNVIEANPCASNFYPMLQQPKRRGGIVYPEKHSLKHSEKFSDKKDLAYAFYKEGLSSSSVYYSFLSFYKIIQLAFDENDAKQKEWVNGNLDQNKIRYPGAIERIQELKNQKKNIAVHLLSAGRLAVAHAKPRGIKAADPDNPEDRRRLNKDLPIIKGLARYAIESGLFNARNSS